MRIQNNIPGMRGLRYGKKVNSETSKTLEKLSSGYRINRASDDAAGLAVSERIRACLNGYDRCEDNVREGINLAATADAALQEVNDMLCRAEELCVAAANGTYTDHERDQLREKLDALYDEMDRIFKSSRFNKTQLFRHEDGDYSNGEFEYIEIVEKTTGELREWGNMENITTRCFNEAEDAKAASVTLTLDSNIQSPEDLRGKEFQVTGKSGYPSYTVKFVSGNGAGSEYSTNLSIGIDDCATVQAAFDKLCKATARSTYWNSNNLVLDEGNTRVRGNAVTLTFVKATLKGSVAETGTQYEIENGDGTVNNGVEISCREDGRLSPIDETGNDFTAYMTVPLYPGKADDYVLTAADKALLESTSINLAGSFVRFKNGSSSGSYIDLNQLTTAKDLRDAVVKKGNSLFAASGKECVISPADPDGTVTITYKNYPSGTWVYDSVSSPSERINTGTLNGIDLQVVQNAAPESYEVTKITLPPLTAMSGDHFTLKVANTQYHFYDKSKLEPGFTGTGINISGLTDAQVYKEIYLRVANAYGQDAGVVLNGNEITITAKTINKQLGVSLTSEASTMISSLENQTSDAVISGNHYFRDYSFTWDIAGTTGNDTSNIIQLAKDGNCVGFRLNGTLYQLVDENSAAVSTEAKMINISGCQTYEAVAEKLATAVPGSTVTVKDGKIIVTGTFAGSNVDMNSLFFEDGFIGQDGLFNEVAGTTSSVRFAGGTKTGEAFALIDFSKYNASNFRELYGKGLQVTCATCKGEYVNVIFCYDRDNFSFVESFEDPDTGLVVHNLVVELKGMTSGRDIVSSIVTQLNPELKHYTGVEEFDGNPSVLRVYDRRLGKQYDATSGELKNAQIKSGVRTNFTYTVKENFYAAPDDIVGDIEIDYRQVRIFADAESVDHYIDIHLPYLTQKNLKLNPPEPDLSTPEAAAETMKRVLNANNAISSVRGVLGADYNRLEHAAANLSQAAVQAADAYSRIRDADIAELMTERVKQSILQQAQQAAQAHTLEMPQQILKILQS